MDEVAPGIEARVVRLFEAMGVEVRLEARRAVARWITMVSAWNRKIDLTAARSDDELVDLMLADAAVIGPKMPPGARVIDVGTGAGAPGLPIALLRADLSMTLVEPLQKRIALLRTASFELTKGASDAGRVRVVRGRGEDLAERGETFDVAISRATLPPPEWLRLGAELAPAGEVWVLVAREEPPTLEGWRAADDTRYRWPLTSAERRAVRFVRSDAQAS